MYETAGSLHGGKRVWMMASIPKEYRAGPDDLIKPYVLLTNTHDGSQALRMIPTTVPRGMPEHAQSGPAGGGR